MEIAINKPHPLQEKWNNLECNCGKDDDGWTPFYFHSEDCPRYKAIAVGFFDTVFEDKELREECD